MKTYSSVHHAAVGAARVLAGTAILLAANATTANASTLLFDFGRIGANGGAVCAHNCVLPTAGENSFTTGGVAVEAIGYGADDAVAYVTQKPGAFAAGGGESGLGESNTANVSSDPEYEIERSTYLLLDNTQALAKHYTISSISIESIQSGEGARVYAYGGSLTAFDPTKLSLLDTLSAPATGGVTQTVSVPSLSRYLVVQAYRPSQGSAASNVVVAQEALTSGVPEPVSWALMLVGFGGVGAITRQRRLSAVAV